MNQLPFWLKFAFSAFMVVWVPAVLHTQGPRNFLWLCDIANFVILAGLWLESPLLLASQLLAVAVIDICWALDLGSAVTCGRHLFGGTEYMLDSQTPVYFRALSLFHVVVPVILVYAILRLGYDRRAYLLQALITWCVLPLSFFLTTREANVNWVYGFFGQPQDVLDPRVFLLVIIAAYTVILYLPSHWMAVRLFG